jgi:phosphate transport system substrate-binding protein
MKNKTKNITLLTAAVIVAMAFKPAATSITIKGSDTVLPLSQKEAEVYMKKKPDASITIVGGGSGVGISALIAGTTDICMSSRDLKMEEKLKLQEKKIKQITIGFDARLQIGKRLEGMMKR